MKLYREPVIRLDGVAKTIVQEFLDEKIYVVVKIELHDGVPYARVSDIHGDREKVLDFPVDVLVKQKYNI